MNFDLNDVVNLNEAAVNGGSKEVLLDLKVGFNLTLNEGN